MLRTCVVFSSTCGFFSGWALEKSGATNKHKYQHGGINAPTNAKQPAQSNSFIIQQNILLVVYYK
jgi:hypothetical protein